MIGIILAAASAAISAGSAIAGHKAQKNASKQNEANAKRAYEELLKDLGLREIQEIESTDLTIAQADRQARAAAALARVSAAESGVAGASVDALLQGIVAETGEFKSVAQKNLDMTLDQIDRARESGSIDMLNRINSVPGPNPFAAALKIGGAALDFGTYLYTNRPKPGEE